MCCWCGSTLSSGVVIWRQGWSAGPRTSAVAVEMLRQGDNGVHAADCPAFAQGVTHPQSGHLGGGDFLGLWPPGRSPTRSRGCLPVNGAPGSTGSLQLAVDRALATGRTTGRGSLLKHSDAGAAGAAPPRPPSSRDPHGQTALPKPSTAGSGMTSLTPSCSPRWLRLRPWRITGAGSTTPTGPIRPSRGASP